MASPRIPDAKDHTSRPRGKDQGRLSRREFVRAGLAGMTGVGLWRGFQIAPADDALPAASARTAPAANSPNIILAMTDDQGWGDTGYNGHKVLKTPCLDELAAAGIRFDRFYAAAPVCSPTRGSVLTGRHPNRFGCFTHGKPIRKQEVTIAQVLKTAGYVTGHFGKWHLNGRSGPGRPIRADDPLSPGQVGFDVWVSASNYFELNPTLGRNGKPVRYTGDGSDVIVAEALEFISRAAEANRPFLAVIWYGSPHVPHRALPEDAAAYAQRPKREQNYYGEIAAVDRSIGRLRRELRKSGLADNTIVWFCSDNGGAFGKTSTGGLRGRKGTLWEGGVRVPGILEWPARIRKPVVTGVPCSTMDMYPTIVDLLGLKVPRQPQPIDGISLAALIDGKMRRRPKPMPFWIHGPNHAALIDNQYKLHKVGQRKGDKQAGALRLFDLSQDPTESKDLAPEHPKRAATMKAALEEWQASVKDSLAGKDYPKT